MAKKGVPKMTNPGVINGPTPRTKGGKPATGAGKNMMPGKSAGKVKKVK